MQLSALQRDYSQSESHLVSYLGSVLRTQKLFYRLCQQDYWEFLQHCEDTGIERMAKLVQQEKDEWIAKYDKAMEVYKAQAGSSESLSLWNRQESGADSEQTEMQCQP